MARVSERLRYDSTNNRINTVKNIADDVNETAISGRKLRKISDDPVSSVRVFRNRTKLESLEQYKKTIDFSRGLLNKSEEALVNVNDSLQRVRELAVQLSNGTWSEKDRIGAAKEIKQLAEHIVSLGNSTYGDRYIFGGYKIKNPPISDTGAYMGDDGVLFVQVSDDGFRPVNLSGREIFDVPPEKEGKETTLVQSVTGLYKALEINDVDMVRHSLTRLDGAIERVINSIAIAGARQNALDNVDQQNSILEVNLSKDNNTLEGADLIKSSLDLKRAESALQYTLSSSAKSLSPTLLEFLK